MGHVTSRGRKTEAGGIGRGQNTREWGGDFAGSEASGVDPKTHRVGGWRGAARPPEWRKTPVGAAMEWAGVSSWFRTT